MKILVSKLFTTVTVQDFKPLLLVTSGKTVCVKDWRYVVRICNIDISDLIGVTGTQSTTAATALTKLIGKSVLQNTKHGYG